MIARRKLPPAQIRGRALDIEEIRLVADLRVMHAKVNEVYQVVNAMRQRHSEQEIHKYANEPILAQDIQRVDEIYLWFVKLKELRERRAAQQQSEQSPSVGGARDRGQITTGALYVRQKRVEKT
jgi:hypothetical protein